MVVHHRSATVTVLHGDCLDELRTLPDASVHSVVTDPPYGLEFMGKEWDSFGRGNAASGATAGMTSMGYSDGGKRIPQPTFLGGLNPRCTTCGKSQRGGSPCRCEAPTFTDERGPRLRAFQLWTEQWAAECLRVLKPGGHLLAFGGSRTWHRLAGGIEDAGFEIRDSIAWLYGSGMPKHRSQLKPAFEPIVVARRPMIGTFAVNAAAHGTGMLNIDEVRTEALDSQLAEKYASVQKAQPRDNAIYGEDKRSRAGSKPHDAGRWPTNALVDEDAATELGDAGIYFPTFRYQAKAPDHERPVVDGVEHPTVKPLALMQWLVRLVTPRGGTVLEPFAGSGTTLEACIREGFNVIGIEREADYLPLIMSRIRKDHEQSLFDVFEDTA